MSVADPLPYLETFALAAELGSFTAAARRLQVTQAAVSQRIAALEKELRVSLFLRQSGRSSLTEAGRTLHDFARRIQAMHDQARQAVTGRDSAVSVELAVCVSGVAAGYHLPELLPRFGAKHPHVRLKVRIADSRDVWHAVKHGQADVGLAGARAADDDLEQRRFGRDELVLLVPSGHPWAGREQAEAKELRKEPLIVREAGSGSRMCLEQALARAGHSLGDFRVAMELGGDAAIVESVRRKLGVAFVSSLLLARGASDVASMRVVGLDLGRDLYAVHDRRRALPIPGRLFLDLLFDLGW